MSENAVKIQDFLNPSTHGFVRVACATPRVFLADPKKNLTAHLALIKKADEAHVDAILFPELSLTGYSCDDLFTQDALLSAAKDALLALAEQTEALDMVIIVGVPMAYQSGVYNCAAVLQKGKILGLVPKTYLPNYREFYDKRYFASSVTLQGADHYVSLKDHPPVPLAPHLLFAQKAAGEEMIFGIEVCEDVWAAHTPSTLMALKGAQVIFNLSASPVTIGRDRSRKRLCAATSERLMCAYVYSAAGAGESTTDLSWDGQSLIYENGTLLAEGQRYGHSSLTIADLDVTRLINDRLKCGTFRDSAAPFERSNVSTIDLAPREWRQKDDFYRTLAEHPYVPDDPERLYEDCFDAFNIQVAGLMGRLEATGIKNVVLGISGGLDSTQALIVTTKAFDRLGLPRANIHAYTMPGFGTSTSSRNDALRLMKAFDVSAHTLDIRPAARRMLMDLGHPAGEGEPVYDLVYENVQAGLRTDYLFRLAGQHKGFVVGTGDLSELALGWCTYGVGDHMSHYNVNCGAPKTLISHLIHWASEHECDDKTAKILHSVLRRTISPELIPPDANGATQKTEDTVGPYELVDFYLYYLTRFGMKPSKIAFLAEKAFKGKYRLATIKKWLLVFLKRFFEGSQYKRSCVPNGPKLVRGGALSPRGDWRAPSDTKADLWVDELNENVPD